MAAVVLTVGIGCASYDSRLLDAPDAAPSMVPPPPADSGTAQGQLDAGAPPDAGTHKPDASTSVPDSGHVQDPDAHVDAGHTDSGPATDAGGAMPDAATDSGPADAGCGAGDAEVDCCPNDPAKTAPGQCGCDIADTDGDTDGTADCNDDCPQDAMKTAPGICGCGRADVDQGAVVSCAGLVSALVHRYRFDDTGTTASDSQGDQDGMLMNTTLTGNGQLDLAGGTSNQFVDLPNGLISGLTNATFEVWLHWSGNGTWERIFDFGDNDDGTEGNQGNGQSYLFLTPRVPGFGGAMRVAYSTNGSGSETRVDAADPLSTSGTHHIAVVVDDTNNMLRLYLDGASAGSATLSGSLSGIQDINNWLGRSQYSSDAELGGSLFEFRVYNAALSAEQIALSEADGPDPAYLEP